MKFGWPLWLALASLPLHASVQPCSPDALRQQLLNAKAVAAACAASPNVANCDPAKVGPDHQVPLASGSRLVEFGWLRGALSAAPKSKEAAAQLEGVSLRLDREVQELSRSAALTQSQLHREQALLEQVLSAGAFARSQPESLWGRLWDALSLWLRQALQGSGGQSSTQWITEIVLFGAAAVVLGLVIWWLTRVNRRRVLALRGAPRRDVEADAASADWQVWLRQARELAADQRWREAIHRVYWAAIARLETAGAWRADPARTPREYLGLLECPSARYDDLALLTRAMERFWYGCKAASEQDFENACRLLERVGSA